MNTARKTILILVAVSALGCIPSAPPAMSQADRAAVEDSVRHLAGTAYPDPLHNGYTDG